MPGALLPDLSPPGVFGPCGDPALERDLVQRLAGSTRLESIRT